MKGQTIAGFSAIASPLFGGLATGVALAFLLWHLI